MQEGSGAESLPLLAIVYGSLSLEQPLRDLAAAAEGVARILWVLPFPHKSSRTAARVARAHGDITGDILDASAMSPTQAAEALAAHHPDGITCFIDETIMWTAEVADLLGLPFHSPIAAARLTDKLQQRIALSEHGLPTPDFWDADDLMAEAGHAEPRAADFPLVLKPRRGTSSQDTETLRSMDELRRAVAAHEPGRMLVEGYIPDPTTPTADGSAPYVSVEVLVSAGDISALGVTGRMPLAPPFRETGQYFPADTTDRARASLAEAAVAAVRAIGVTNGVLHVEVKRTDRGPVVIEVNGRPGGGSTCDFMRRAHDIDLVQLTMRVALGEHVAYPSLPRPREVFFRLDVQPDARLRRITAIEGIDAARRIPGVEQVTVGMNVGDAFSWRNGTFTRVAVVTGVAPDHAAARSTRAAVLSTIRIHGTK